MVDNSFACRYNVRETGFIYLAQKPYQLIIYYSDETNEKDIEIIRQLSSDHFSDSNIDPLFVNINSETENPELLSLKPDGSIPLPCTILKSPDGQIKRFVIINNDTALKEYVENVFSEISSSKKRDEIIDKCISNYGVILLFESTNAEANRKAINEVKSAISHIESKMSLLPKKISKPPVLVTIKKNDNDKIISWSLGMDNGTFTKPQAVVIYGRGRWIGPVLEGELILKRNLSELLLIIGADCECGIDREWMRGTMLPAKWGKKTREKAAKNLEFDPENPFIKKEVRHILQMGEIFGNIPGNNTSASYSNTIKPGIIDPSIQAKQPATGMHIKNVALIIAIVAIIILATGSLLFWKLKRRE